MTERRIVKVADLAVGRALGSLVALGLGSCVAIMIWDPEAKVGGMAHVLLPAPPPRGKPPGSGRYAQTAVPALLDRMQEAGAERARLSARLAGGATMFSNLIAPGLIHTGERNVLASREALHRAGVPVTREWVGGDFGRTLVFDLATGRVTASSVKHGERDL